MAKKKKNDDFAYVNEDGRIFQRRMVPVQAEATLDANVYTVKCDMKMGYFFQKLASSFEMPKKLYGGDIEKKAARILSTYRARPRSTGVLLNGRKGAGKTLLAKYLCNLSEMPVISISEPFCDTDFLELLKNINQEKVVLFDEFEKVYHEIEHQNTLLTLLDGVYDSKTLFILVTNTTEFMAAQLHNRPGRIFYSIDYDGLPDSFVRSYAEEHLHRKEHAETLVRLNSLVSEFNFDLMSSVIEECNRYQCAPRDCIEMLNIASSPKSLKYHVELTYNGKPCALRYGVDVKYINLEDGTFEVNLCEEWWEENRDEEAFKDYPRGSMYPYASFDLEDLQDLKDGVYTFEREGVQLRLRPGRKDVSLLDFI